MRFAAHLMSDGATTVDLAVPLPRLANNSHTSAFLLASRAVAQ
jgi:hypothetical protein